MALPTRGEIRKELLSLLKKRKVATPTEAYSYLALHFELSFDDLAIKREKRSLFEHEVRWAKQELTIMGMIARPGAAGRAIWRLESLLSPDQMPEQLSAKGNFIEGAATPVLINRYERNRRARQLCISHYGPKCSVCDFDFSEMYGPLGEGCIHVHHAVPISEVRHSYQVDPRKDLRPVCPNCHYMLHRREPPFAIAEMRAIVARNRRTK